MGWEAKLDRAITIAILVFMAAASVAMYLVLFPQEPSTLVAFAGFGNSSIDYYPASLYEKNVKIEYYDDKTVITIDKKTAQWEIACTGSMHPAMGCGNILLAEKISPSDEVYLGDIVIYRLGERYISHQVVAYDEEENCYQLKGINSPAIDPECVKKEDIDSRGVLVLPTKQ